MTDYTQLTAEDLWMRLNQESGRDRVEVLAELGNRAFSKGEYGQARTLLKEAVVAAEQVGDRQLLAEILHLLGAAASNAGDAIASGREYRRAGQAFREIGMSRAAAQAAMGQADAHRDLGHLEDCLESAREASGFADSIGDCSLAAEAYHLQASVLLELGRDQETLTACAAATTHLRQDGCASQVLEIGDIAITAHLRLGQWDNALHVARECLALAHSSEADTSWTRYRVAEVLHFGGRHSEALEEAQGAQQHFYKGDNLIGVAQCQRLTGEALIGMGRHHEALDAFEQARALFDATGDVREALRCAVDQAHVWQILGAHGEAERINGQLVQAFAELEQESSDAQFSAVRLLDNLNAQGHFHQCCDTAEELTALWPDEPTAAIPSYREFLARWTWAMYQTGRVEYAVAMVSHVIKHLPAGIDGSAAADCFEVRGRYRLTHQTPGAAHDLARATSAHLSLGHEERAGAVASLLVQALGCTDVTQSAHAAIPAA
jgi:tetratricopeptide (TPR) repeat protein